jgi:hypothetical protein
LSSRCFFIAERSVKRLSKTVDKKACKVKISGDNTHPLSKSSGDEMSVIKNEIKIVLKKLAKEK